MNSALHDYLETALWSSSDDNEQPLDAKYTIADFAPEAIAQAQRDLEGFFALTVDTLSEDEITAGRVAHDFWLTRNYHGAGFWDGGYQHGDALTRDAHAFGACWIVVGDDGKLYFA